MKYFGSMVALITPFKENGDLDIETLESLINLHIESKTDALVLCATTAEAPTLEDSERFKILETAIKLAYGKTKIIAGTGTYSTKKTIALTKKAKDIGVDASLIVLPYYNKPTFNGIFKHFEEIAKVDLDIILYHHPGRTGVSLNISDFIKLSEIDKIVAVKEASGDLELAKNIIEKTRFDVLSGDDPLTFKMVKMGAVGVISVIANLIPKVWKKYNDLLLNNEFEKAMLIYLENKELINCAFLESNPICIKYAMSLMNMCKSTLRLPLVEPSDVNKAKIFEILDEKKLLKFKKSKV